MAVYFSDHFNSTSGATSLADPTQIVSAGVNGGRLRYKKGTITDTVTSGEVMRFFTMKSSDRLIELHISSDGGSDAGAVNVGIYLAGTNHDGAVVDADLFGSAVTISTAIDRTDAWTESTTLDGTDRGKALWAQAAVGAGSDTSDPGVLYDICCVASTTFTTADSIITLEAVYTAGD